MWNSIHNMNYFGVSVFARIISDWGKWIIVFSLTYFWFHCVVQYQPDTNKFFVLLIYLRKFTIIHQRTNTTRLNILSWNCKINKTCTSEFPCFKLTYEKCRAEMQCKKEEFPKRALAKEVFEVVNISGHLWVQYWVEDGGGGQWYVLTNQSLTIPNIRIELNLAYIFWKRDEFVLLFPRTRSIIVRKFDHSRHVPCVYHCDLFRF